MADKYAGEGMARAILPSVIPMILGAALIRLGRNLAKRGDDAIQPF